MLRVRNDESAAVLMLELMLMFGDLERAFGLPRIHGHRFEFNVPGGRIDLLLFHEDGGMSIVEAKSESADREIVRGIGQLCLYAVALPRVLSSRQQPKYIRRILCAPIAPEECGRLMDACALAGVEFKQLPPFAMFKAQIEAAGLRAA